MSMRAIRPLRADQEFFRITAIRLIIILSVLFSLLPYGLSWDYTGTSSLTMEGSLAVKLEWSSLFAIAGWLLYRNPLASLRDLRSLNPFLVLVLLWCALSTLWSPLPAVTFKRAIQLYGLTALALSLQQIPQALNELVRYVAYTLTGLLLLSLFIVVSSPATGIDYALGGAWRGALSQKNELGQVAAMCILLWQVRACLEKVDIRVLLPALLLSLFMLVMSKSSTSMIITLLTTACFHLLRKQHFQSSYALSRILASLMCLSILLVYGFYMQESRLPTWAELSGPVASIFGKGTDLTGRTEIWELVQQEINRHWLLGLGYGAFWLGPDSLSQFVIDALHWVPLQSHNGYLDILNEQGLIGLILTVLTILAQAWSLVQLSRLNRPQAAFWSAMLLIVIITNFTESSLFRGFGFQNVFFIIALVSSRASWMRLKSAGQQQADGREMVRAN